MRKVGDKDYIRRSNADDRDDLIKSIGRHEFETCGHYDDLQDKPVPPCFQYIFEIFLELYNMSGENGITFNDIATYSKVRKVELSQLELDYILKCRAWASKEIHELEKKEES